MAEHDTIAVRWPKKFGQRTVLIAREDFDPAVHSLPGEAPAVEAAPAEPAAPVAAPLRRRRGE